MIFLRPFKKDYYFAKPNFCNDRGNDASGGLLWSKRHFAVGCKWDRVIGRTLRIFQPILLHFLRDSGKNALCPYKIRWTFKRHYSENSIDHSWFGSFRSSRCINYKKGCENGLSKSCNRLNKLSIDDSLDVFAVIGPKRYLDQLSLLPLDLLLGRPCHALLRLLDFFVYDRFWPCPICCYCRWTTHRH